MKNQKRLSTVLIILIIIILVFGGGYYIYKNNNSKIEDVIKNDDKPDNIDPSLPFIKSISESSGPIGSVIELKGNNLAGFEGSLDAIIENDLGETAFLPGIGSVPRENETIRVKIESRLCTMDISYKGGDCPKYLNIVPGVYKIYTSPWGKNSNKIQLTVTPSDQTTVTLYLQDKEIAMNSDCSVTYPVNYQIPKTVAVVDASLKILFESELSQYGVYKSVIISNKIAKITLQSSTTPSGRPLSGLSSCEKGHLLSVLNDTITQYPTVSSVELFSPNGKIDF